MKSNTPEPGYRWSRSEMKGMLKKGDYVRIAEITGFTMDYIIKVVNDVRDSDFVWMIIHKYLGAREQLSEEARNIRELKLLPEKY